MDTNTFIQTFHNLGGTNLGDRQKLFNVLLRNVPLDHDAVLAAIAPKNNFENLLKLKLLLKLQRLPDLIQIFKDEDEYLPAKLLKNRWFCQKLAATLDENSEGFVESLLPHTSYVIRRRVISRLAAFGAKLDRIFDEMRLRYGIHNASPLLVACSREKIANVLQSEEKIALAPLYQKLLYRKHPQLFARFAANSLGNVDSSVVRYIARCSIDDFLILMKDVKYFSGGLGKRLTRKILIHHKDGVIADSQNFSCVLHLKTVIKVLSEADFRVFVHNCAPPNFDNLVYYSHIGFNDLRCKLGNKYYRYLFDLVSEKYKKSLYSFPDLVTEEMMASMEIEERLTWISIKTKTETDNKWVRFMKISDSIPLIKNKINVTSSIDTRGDLVRQLLKTCDINKDLNALAQVCDYVSTRHKNDDEDILGNFLFELQACSLMEKLDERHWKPLNLIFEVLRRRNSGGYYVDALRLKYLDFLNKRKKLTDNDIRYFFTRVKDYRQHKCSAELQKILLLKKIDFVPTLLAKDEKLEYKDLYLIIEILGWNKTHAEDKIALLDYPRLVSSLEKCLTIAQESDSYINELNSLGRVAEIFICTKEKSNLREVITQKYFSVNFRFYNVEIDFWLLKHDPDVIYGHFDKFLEHVFHFSPNRLLLNFMKTYTDSNFQERVLNHCLRIVGSGIEASENVVFQTLASLETPEKFLQCIAPFCPPSHKIDEFEEDKKKVKIAIAIAESFKYATSTLVLPTLVTYCKGDYLRYSLESLYYRFYHSPENQLTVFINDLSSKAVSVRKHSIFLARTVLNVSDVQNLLKRFIDTEKNVSVLKHLCMATLQYFVKNPSDEFWEYLKVCMTKLDKNDTESFNMLVNLHRIPKKYQCRHVIFVWGILKKSEDKHRPRLLSSIPRELFADFPLEFLLEVISENLFQPGASCETTINNFIVSCLIQSVHRNEISSTVFRIVKTVSVARTQSLEEEQSNREKLANFVGSVVSGLTSETAYDTLRAFSSEWHALFPPLEAMKEHLKLSFALLYLESGKDLTKFAMTVTQFYESFVSTYSVALVDCFASELVDSLKMFLCRYRDMGADYFKLLLSVAKLGNFIFQLLAVKMLPGKQPSCEDDKILFTQIVELLRSVPQESIQVLMNLYVTDLE